MKKAYNVYKIYGKTNIPKFLRGLSFMFLLGVCFLGFQTQTTAQAVLQAYGPDGPIPSTNAVTKTTTKLIGATTFAVTEENALSVLKHHRREVASRTYSDGMDELRQQYAVMLLDASMTNLSKGLSLNESLIVAYRSVVSSPVASRYSGLSLKPADVLNGILDLLK